MSGIKESLERLMNGQIPVSVIGGVVTAVRPDEDTCDVQPDSDDAEVFDVALLNGIYPAVGAQVLIGLVENRLVDTFLISADKVTHFRFTTEQESLLTLQRDLLDELVKLTVTTPAGPSGPPINAPALLALKARFDNLLLP
ncbi:hypothetical protein [Hymenobacter swuensis]|uniref:Uncharacterized protein n=1 Tax=Hymenobacter swuensis DY53 TaxID=1227739 RepID=W8F4K9_9BACT|nr:hypothetical protein [Hymenobacter swuensis]AHJ98927.1 hypothetical protein Hsw_3332 [Hymenobacter swuensis DY53]